MVSSIVVGPAAREWELTPTQVATSEEQLTRLRHRLVRRGFTGRLTLTSSPVTRVRVDEVLGEQHLIRSRARIDGQAPRYRGWRLVAEVAARADGGADIRAAAGVHDLGTVDLDDVRGGGCVECGTERGRRVSYLLLDAAGTTRLVGASCLARMVGAPRVAFLTDADVVAHLGWGAGDSWPESFTPATVLGTACAAVIVFGWAPGSRLGSTTARTVAALAVHGSPRARTALADAIGRGRDISGGWDLTQAVRRFPDGVAPAQISDLIRGHGSLLAAVETRKHDGRERDSR